MARLGAHTFIWVDDWTRENAEFVLEAAAAAELDLVEIPLLRPSEIDVSHSVAAAARLGLGLTCSLGLPLQSTLPDHPDEAQAFLMGALDVAKAFGSWCLTGVTYSTIGKLSGAPPTEAEYAAIASALRPVARHAASLGLELGLEPCNRYETHLLNTGEQAVALIERIGESNVFVHLDTYHMAIEEEGFAASIERLGRHVRYVHLSETGRRIPGRGNVDWDQVFRGLKAAGYDGDLVLESFVSIHPDIARALAVWRPVAPSIDLLIGEGFGFLRRKMTEHGLRAQSASIARTP